MKRREFIIASASLAGWAVPRISQGQTKPCPPPTVGIEGAASSTTSCAINATSDWLYRIGRSGSNPHADGIVWYHDFESKSEVDQFRWAGGYGNDPSDLSRPNTVRWLETDGITNGCLEIWRPTGSSDGAVWWRPFAPLNAASNGRGAADPASASQIPLVSFSPTSKGSQTVNLHDNNYAPSSVNASWPNHTFDGEEFYFQARVKMDPNRMQTEPNGGKLFYFTRTEASNVPQEIVVQSRRKAYDSGNNMFGMYRSGGITLESDDRSWGNGSQPGTEWGTSGQYCSFVNNPTGYVNNCWHWTGGWDTVLWRIRPGRKDAAETEIEVWACRAGEESRGYVRIWKQTKVPMPYASTVGSGSLPIPPAYNALICSSYQNAANVTTAFYHRYCQLIFSRKFIPCPQF